ncbi:MAG: hypothetical protein JO347_11720 [Candidatus Eremiobacteraeota bacterium]|nr:hypothetical protein [Candidatus Eremiobacteraeota bacterium]
MRVVRTSAPRVQAPLAAPVRPAAPRRPGPGAARGAGDAIDQGAPPGAHEAELQLALAAQAARFDAMMKVLAEQQREINAIIDLGMAQTKRDDALMNQWIRLI